MPVGTAFKSPKNVDYHIKQLSKAIQSYQEARDFPLPEHLLRQRLYLALRAADVVQSRRSIADTDWLLDPKTFQETEGQGEYWKTQAATPRTTPAKQPTQAPEEIERREAMKSLEAQIALHEKHAT